MMKDEVNPIIHLLAMGVVFSTGSILFFLFSLGIWEIGKYWMVSQVSLNLVGIIKICLFLVELTMYTIFGLGFIAWAISTLVSFFDKRNWMIM